MAFVDPQLLTLLQLRETRLAAGEGIAVRQRLAEDAEFRRHWQTLTQALAKPAPLADVDETRTCDAETVAAFVEGRLSRESAAVLEASCWRDEAALREVAAAFCAVQAGDHRIAARADVHGCLTRFVESEVIEPEQQDFVESSTLHSTIGTRRIVGGNDDADDEHQGRSRVPVHRRRSESAVGGRGAGSGRRRWVVAAVGLFLVLVVAAILLAVRSGDRPGNSPVVRRPSPAENPPAGGDGGPKVRHDSPAALPVARDNRSGDGTIAVNPPRRRPSREHSPAEIPVPAPVDRASVPMQIGWKDVSGIVARRANDADFWSGLLANRETELDISAVTVHALPQSWARAAVSDVVEIVVDSDTRVRLSAARQENESHSPITIELQLSAGRVAVSGLRNADRILLRDASREWFIRSNSDETEVGVLQLDNLRRQVVVWSGAAEIDGLTLAAGSSITWNGRMFEEPSADTPRFDWSTPPRLRLAMNDAQIDRINRSDNVLQALEAVDRGARPQEETEAAALAFALDAVSAVPAAAESGSEARRLAAIAWLLNADDAHPDTAAVWKKIEASIAAGQTQTAVRSWFQAAQSQTRPSRQQLAELSAGLGPQQPLFARQSAIHFLRQISGLPLAEYDADRPTKTAADQVRQKLRRATGNGRRRSP